MVKHYLITALRNMTRHKTYSAINVLGLATGIAFCLLTFLFVRHEWTYDQFHEHADRIYRILSTFSTDNVTATESLLPETMGPLLKAEFPQLQYVARIYDGRKQTLEMGDRHVSERTLFVDPDFLNVFSFPLLQGDKETALGDPGAIVLSQSAARNCFGNENPMGKEVSIASYHWQNLLRTFTVRGVMKDPPSNSSIQFGALLPRALIPSLKATGMPNAPGNDPSDLNFFALSDYVFVRLHDQAHIEDVEEGLPHFAETHQADGMRRKVALTLQPLTDMHFDRRMTYNLEPPGNPQEAYILSAIALIVLLIACVNFTNLTVARFATRTREVGVRKLVGAQRGQLMRQFWGESLVITMLAVILGFALAEFFLPTFNRLIQTQLAMQYTAPGSFVLFVALLFILVGLTSGIYPAVILSRFQPVTVLKDRLRLGGNGALRRALVIVQFAASILLVIAATAMFRQVAFLKTKDLGLLGKQVVAISAQSPQLTGNFETRRRESIRLLSLFAQKLKSDPGIVDFTRSNVFANMGADHRLQEWPVRLPDGTKINVPSLEIDRDFIDALGIDLIAGRNFSDKPGAETLHILVNETLVKQFGLKEPVGAQFPVEYVMPVDKDIRHLRVVRNPEIIGVVKDFHVRSLHEAIPPLVMFLHPGGGDFLVRIRPDQTAQTLALMARQWREISDNAPFHYVFLDERFERLYRPEERWEAIIGYASAFALFVACLGVLGLTAMAVARRTKEFGIRKVLGAAPRHIAILLSKEFMSLILAANAIAWPAAYYGVHRWLQDFAYRIPLGPGLFLLGGALVFLTALLTIALQALRAARRNPVDALRYE